VIISGSLILCQNDDYCRSFARPNCDYIVAIIDYVGIVGSDSGGGHFVHFDKNWKFWATLALGMTF